MIDLVGHILNKAEYNGEDQSLSLTVDGDKVFLLKVEGYCCSDGKFIGVTSSFRLELPSKVIATKKETTDFDVDSDCYRVYEETLVLENGKELKIVYDNMSNGYYGSNLAAYYGGKMLYGFPKEEVKK